MNLLEHLSIVFRMVTTAVNSPAHAERMEQFYRSQAARYDEFRGYLLHGRQDMMRAVPIPDGGHLIDFGGGTGFNIEALGDPSRLGRVEIVDLCPSLLGQARERITRRGWHNVHAIEADATTYRPASGPVDAVTFSYSLTMIPDWFRAIDNALAILKPGGVIGVVDYYHSRKWPAPNQHRHSTFARWFWPWLFGYANVFPTGDHLPYLQSRFEVISCEERLGRMPYVPWGAPYYLFIGRRPA